MNEQQLNIQRHSLAHLMAAAVQKLWPAARFGVGPVIENGFYYDVEIPASPANSAGPAGRPGYSLTEEDLKKIEKEMAGLLKKNLDFKREEITIAEALKLFTKLNQPYKIELLNDLKIKGTTRLDESEKELMPEGSSKVSIYQTGEFIDLCRGPHVKNTHDLKAAFKLNRLAGAYWRGSEKNPMLTRLYGLAFAGQKELDEHLKLMEEAQKRDHRKIGSSQELFTFDNLVGKGLPLWLPKGTIIKDEIEKLAKEMENQDGYLRVSTPHLGKKELYETSGHLPYYAELMYPAMEADDGIYYLKAMNCPHHHLIYKSKLRSYKELPLRLAEYGTVYRNELSGTLAGLLRVRSLSMNDAHLYCRKNQLKEEIKKVIILNQKYFKIFGFNDYWYRLSLWDPKHTEKYINEPQNWRDSENILRDLLKEMKVKFVEAKNEAAFYGPKIDVQFKSIIGREETMSTIQLDFTAKSRFNLSYINEKGKEENEVFVIHRAPLSTHERFIAFLIEHFAGAFPLWLSPVQIKILNVGSAHQEFCEQLAAKLKNENIRVELDLANETVGNKIRKAAGEKIPYLLVIGDKEMKSDKLMVRVRYMEKLLEISYQEFVEKINGLIKEKSLAL